MELKYNVKEKPLKCDRCKEYKPRDQYTLTKSGNVYNRCLACRNDVKNKPKKRMTKMKVKKAVVTEFEKIEQRMNAIEVLALMKAREAELVASGAKYVKGELRSYKLVR